MESAQSVPHAPRIAFRQMGEDDLDLIHSLLGDPEVMVHYPRTKTREECLGWIRWNMNSYQDHGHGLWILEDETGRFLGECGLVIQNIEGPRPEIGYHLRPTAQGHGYAAEAAHACVDFAREAGLPEVISIIAAENLPSQKVAERAGLSRWKDVDIFGGPKRIYRLELSEPSAAPVDGSAPSASSASIDT